MLYSSDLDDSKSYRRGRLGALPRFDPAGTSCCACSRRWPYLPRDRGASPRQREHRQAHLEHIYEKLGVRNRLEMEHRLPPPTEELLLAVTSLPFAPNVSACVANWLSFC